MIKLTHAQTRLLHALAAAREGLPRAAGQGRSAAPLRAAGYIEDFTTEDDRVWQRITQTGRSLLPQTALSGSSSPAGKLGQIVVLLKRPEGATIADMTQATGWQAHSVRGALAGSLRKKHGLPIVSAKRDGLRTYSLEAQA